MCKSLQKLDLSYCKQIDDKVAVTLCSELPQLKNISLRFCNLLTGETLRAITDNLKDLEGLDVSGCFAMDLSGLLRLRGNSVLKCLLLEYLVIKSEHLRPLKDTQISTLSVFYSKNLSFTHLETIKEIPSLTNLNMQDCPQITEECKF